MNKIFFPVISSLVFSASISHAALIESDYLSLGDSLITYDSSSHLEWLDISQTRSLTINQINSNYGGFAGSGFRYASTDEVLGLLTSNGLSITGWGNTTVDGYSNMVELISLLGGETDYGFSKTINALTGDVNAQSRHDLIYFGYYYSDNNPAQYWVDPLQGSRSSDESSYNVGSFLVREVAAVPMPASMVFFMSGVFSLFGLSKRKLLFRG